MSVEAITWALNLKMDRSSEKFVLVALANCANSDGICWPSILYLCEATCQDRKTVIANIGRLIENGFICDTYERRGKTKQVLVYQLVINKQCQKRNSTEKGTVPNFPPNSTVFPVKESRFSSETVPKTGHGTVKEPSIEPSINRHKEKAVKKIKFDFASALKRHQVSEKHISEWLEVRKSKGGVNTETAFDNFIAQVGKSGLSVADAVEICITRSWAGFNSDWLAPKSNQLSSKPAIDQVAQTIKLIKKYESDKKLKPDSVPSLKSLIKVRDYA